MEFLARGAEAQTVTDEEYDAAQKIRALFRAKRDREVLIPRMRAGLPTMPFVAMPDSVIAALPAFAGINAESTVVDLGCGDGRVLLQLRLATGCSGRGCDIDAGFISQAEATAQRLGHADAMTFLTADIMNYALGEADVFVLFGTPEVMRSYAPRLLPQLRPGMTFVSYHFPFEAIGVATAELDVEHPLIKDGATTTKLYRYDITEASACAGEAAAPAAPPSADASS
mmetsp:Transcript_40844/g.127941  ORF Transcript_40844/g.127941 Transcript_40844/m.127941 type:complete len:227 (-) Transcript_40844:135-815(-)|eukprot:CAMPEP_0118868692 /NCGR_PEP_ID=MMETSP1163-20130328/12143_1 /TAXON_ID=124430 /ORGANISM="Phaeomonas parva, Strain CCMP2877" /LENGTH=226 /DNA_ID=CAMNT_0006803445 /DNA_START=139 /DNA_END=819 /DNA_ORIENTATION=+